jgi:hypothetical protein
MNLDDAVVELGGEIPEFFERVFGLLFAMDVEVGEFFPGLDKVPKYRFVIPSDSDRPWSRAKRREKGASASRGTLGFWGLN